MGELKLSVYVRKYETFSVAEDRNGYRIIEYQKPLVKKPRTERFALQVWDDRNDRYITIHRTATLEHAKRRLRSFLSAT